MSSAVVIATKGRAGVVAATVHSIRRAAPAIPILIIGTCPADIADVSVEGPTFPRVGPSGLTRQRNEGIRQAEKFAPGLIYFFDDDIELHPAYFEYVEAFMAARPGVVAGSGQVEADGHVTRAEAIRRLTRAAPGAEEQFRTAGRHWTLYGCNMFIRAAALRRVQFDERLPRYSWGEDYAISIALRRIGLVGRLNRALCVHLKDGGGRIDHRQLAFAMSSNVFYFHRAGCVHHHQAIATLRLLYLLAFRIPLLEVRRHRLTRMQTVQWWMGWIAAVREILSGRSRPENLAIRYP